MNHIAKHKIDIDLVSMRNNIHDNWVKIDYNTTAVLNSAWKKYSLDNCEQVQELNQFYTDLLGCKVTPLCYIQPAGHSILKHIDTSCKSSINIILNDTTSALSSAMDTIGNFFSDTIEGLGDLAEGGTFGESDIESAKRKVEQFQKMNPYIDVMNMSFEEAKALIIENVNADKKSNKKRRIESKIRALKRLHGADAQSEGGLGVGSIKILRESGVDIPALGDRLTALKEEKEALEGFKADKIRGFSDYRDYYDIDDATRIGKGAITSKLNSVIKEIAELEQVVQGYEDRLNSTRMV